MESFTAARSTGELGAFECRAITGLCSASHLWKLLHIRDLTELYKMPHFAI